MYRQSGKTVVLGGLKVGTKRLYVRTITADLVEIEPVCVLDFYVHESCQRKGIGKALFEHFLNADGCDPACLAYDRPSPKLLAFLRKHYGLQEYVPQSNNYVVFNRYFELNPTAASTSRGQGRLGSRGSATSGSTTPNVHPLHSSRSTPPVPPPALSRLPLSPLPSAPAHPGWGGAGGMPGSSPSFGRRWASRNFGPGTGQESSSGAAATPYGVGDGEASSYNRSLGDSLDAFSRSHVNACTGGRQSASWEGPGPSGVPPGSRSGYASRPPWAVDDGLPGGDGSPTGVSGYGPAAAASVARTPQPLEQLGPSLSSTPTRGPLQSILSGGGVRDGGGSGPHLRALQLQVAALQLSDGTGTGSQGTGAMQTPPPASQQQQWGRTGAPGTGSRLGGGAENTAAAGRSAARIMAVAQKSGAGAADCLVW
ncbi:hypothetical protein VOLCADRAFT_90683 [Volvox carteri f. nagariensis]|uniref:N-acetyltransferase domain-containing protein n=1 Tax=Volvox carteri f. nagariensis TaxID=3068 RepID=D8TVF9_VOLCA|nr:uncharacterized protein VOLCADRAFT_90683 [Volvox carteri f. nagariensis]EFJ48571.1 hypothetical protein VOLCADRAFT_90683 [Volvox carteri f. nagariensis]|eukprot:XP_002950370.1 hypothetical protein VOLCADRAFT_90683 [Volvox carteri f. nagariensis]